MRSSCDRLDQLCEEIVKGCTNCDRCISECNVLKEIGENPISIATRQPTVQEAYSCTLCSLCQAVCPVSLGLREIFYQTRKDAVDGNKININDYRYMFPDRKTNVLSLYREVNQINYDDLSPDRESSVAFFPGCTMLTYSPELTRLLFQQIKKDHEKLALITICCGLPISQLGLQSRADAHSSFVQSQLVNLKVKSLVIACPNCYYQLRLILKDSGINLVTIYEALELRYLSSRTQKSNQERTVTVHDSCPDRFEGIFADQVRTILRRKGYNLVEMPYNRQMTVCCGSGGQVTHFRPDLAEQLVDSHLAQAEESGAQVLAGYCLACVLNFAKKAGQLKIQHVLNLLLDLEQDFTWIKTKANEMFSGPEGEKRWERIMSE